MRIIIGIKTIVAETDHFGRISYFMRRSEEKIIINKEIVKLYNESNGFYAAVSEAWAKHGNLILSPDDIWMATQLQVSQYIAENSKRLRDRFVDHERQQEINIDTTDIRAESNWPVFMDRVITEIRRRVKNNVDKDFLPSFSCSSDLPKHIKHLAVMDVMQYYFTYTRSTACGIESVGLSVQMMIGRYYIAVY